MHKSKTPLEIVADLSGSKSLDIDTNQANRYCIRLHSSKGKEAYYFGTPIYNAESRKLLRCKFIAANGYYKFIGSNCEVTVTETQIKLMRQKQHFYINLGKTYSWVLRDGWLISNQLSIAPTYNGICIVGNILYMSFDTVINFEYQNIRSSQNCICFMESLFKPIVVMSALFSAKKNEKPHPLQIRYSENTAKKGNLSFFRKIHFAIIAFVNLISTNQN